MATCKFRKSKFISTKNNRKYRSRNQVGGGRGEESTPRPTPPPARTPNPTLDSRVKKDNRKVELQRMKDSIKEWLQSRIYTHNRKESIQAKARKAEARDEAKWVMEEWAAREVGHGAWEAREERWTPEEEKKENLEDGANLRVVKHLNVRALKNHTNANIRKLVDGNINHVNIGPTIKCSGIKSI